MKLFNWRIFVVALAFSLVISAISYLDQFLFMIFRFPPRDWAWIALLFSVASFVVSPVLLFAYFFFTGGKIDLAAEFSSVVVPLFLGSWVGHVVGYYTLQFLYLSQYGGTFLDPWVFGFLWYAFRIAFSFEFFVGFAALSMAYIARKRSL